MVVRSRFSVAAIFAAAALFLGAAGARAQCTVIAVTNNLPGSVDLTLVDQTVMPPATATKTIPVGGATAFVLPAGFTVSGFNGATGVFHAFPAQPPRPACAMTGTGVAACVALPATPPPPPSVWCAYVCYNDSTCTMTLTSCPSNICTP